MFLSSELILFWISSEQKLGHKFRYLVQKIIKILFQKVLLLKSNNNKLIKFHILGLLNNHLIISPLLAQHRRIFSFTHISLSVAMKVDWELILTFIEAVDQKLQWINLNREARVHLLLVETPHELKDYAGRKQCVKLILHLFEMGQRTAEFVIFNRFSLNYFVEGAILHKFGICIIKRGRELKFLSFFHS